MKPLSAREMCACMKPLPSGRLYFGVSSCRLCGELIYGQDAYRRQSYAEAVADRDLAAKGRRRIKGGLPPRRTIPEPPSRFSGI